MLMSHPHSHSPLHCVSFAVSKACESDAQRVHVLEWLGRHGDARGGGELHLLGDPAQPLVQPLARQRAARLQVPVVARHVMKAQALANLRRRHRVLQVLRSSQQRTRFPNSRPPLSCFAPGAKRRSTCGSLQATWMGAWVTPTQRSSAGDCCYCRAVLVVLLLSRWY
jgi:hypothetical protein